MPARRLTNGVTTPSRVQRQPLGGTALESPRLCSALCRPNGVLKESGHLQGLGGKAGYHSSRRLFLARWHFSGLLPTGRSSDLSLGLWEMRIRHSRRASVVLGRGERELELGRSRMVSYGVARLTPSGDGI